MENGDIMTIKNLTMFFGVQELYHDININIKENEKVGIIGVNGAGKTTLFKIMLGLIEPDHGKIIFQNNARIEWLPQIIDEEIPSLDMRVYDFLKTGRPIDKLNQKLQKLYEELARSSEEKQKELFKKIDYVENKLAYWNVYGAESELLKIIEGMNISSELLQQSIKTLSGGQKSKIAFAKLLYSKPEVMLLDEPTNHLDSETKDFVEKYLRSYKGSIYVISHDTSFLDAITTQILFLDKRTKEFKLYEGNYSNFLKLKESEDEALEHQALIQQKEEEKLKTIITKYATASGKRKKMAQDREKKLAKLLENKVGLLPELKKSKIIMEMERESNNVPLQVKNVSFKYPNSNKYLFENLSFALSRGEKFLIVGENGVGKSTLLKLIMGILTPIVGEIQLGSKTDVAYYAQEHELLNQNKTIIENFSDIDLSIRTLRSVLGRFLFLGDDVYKKISVLSPGERSRVALAKLSLKRANFLVLDEPTNHLDPETQFIIADTFKEFPGTMLVVSHNPEFVDYLGIERVLFLPSGKIDYYSRGVVEYYHEVNNKKNN